MTDADETRAKINQALENVRHARTQVGLTEGLIEETKTLVTLIGFGSLRIDVQYMAQILTRTLMELATIKVRMDRLEIGLEEWQDAQ